MSLPPPRRRVAERAQTLPDWTPEELAELTCRVPGCTLLITLNNHFCDHHAEQLRKLRACRPPRRPAPPPRAVR